MLANYRTTATPIPTLASTFSANTLTKVSVPECGSNKRLAYTMLFRDINSW